MKRLYDEEDIQEASIEELREEVRLLWGALKELDECNKCKPCRDCVSRIACGKSLNKPKLTIVKN